MSFLDWFRREPDAIGDIRSALFKLTERAIRDGATEDQAWSLTCRGCSMRGVPVGDWQFIVRPVHRDSDAGFAGDRNGLHPEGAAARAEGIAHPPFPSEQP